MLIVPQSTIDPDATIPPPSKLDRTITQLPSTPTLQIQYDTLTPTPPHISHQNTPTLPPLSHQVQTTSEPACPHHVTTTQPGSHADTPTTQQPQQISHPHISSRLGTKQPLSPIHDNQPPPSPPVTPSPILPSPPQTYPHHAVQHAIGMNWITSHFHLIVTHISHLLGTFMSCPISSTLLTIILLLHLINNHPCTK